MPEPFDLASLNLEADSEVMRLVGEHPEIRPLRYRDGEYLIREGEDSREVLLVLKGAYAVEKASARPGLPPTLLATVLCNLEMPGIVGEMAYFGAEPRSASVRSSGSSFALQLQPAHLDAVIAGCPGLTRVICGQFSGRLREMNRLLADFQARFAMNPTQRLANPGDCLFRAGDPARTLFQLATGAVRLERGGRTEVVPADQLPQGFLEPGPYFRNALHECTATVESHAFVVAIERDHVQSVVRAYPNLVLGLL